MGFWTRGQRLPQFLMVGDSLGTRGGFDATQLNLDASQWLTYAQGSAPQFVPCNGFFTGTDPIQQNWDNYMSAQSFSFFQRVAQRGILPNQINWNYSKSGALYADMVTNTELAITQGATPEYMVVVGGTNDLSDAQVAGTYTPGTVTNALDAIKAAIPGVGRGLIRNIPSRALNTSGQGPVAEGILDDMNAECEAWADLNGFGYADAFTVLGGHSPDPALFEDNTHPNNEGFRRVGIVMGDAV